MGILRETQRSPPKLFDKSLLLQAQESSSVLDTQLEGVRAFVETEGTVEIAQELKSVNRVVTDGLATT